jgi:hypothetical protein
MREEKQLQNATCKTQQRVHVEELGVNGEVILKWVLNCVEREDWIYWARVKFPGGGLNTVIETWVLLKAKGFLTSWVTTGISGIRSWF